MSKIKLAVIGLGGRGTFHANVLSEMADVEITAVCDVYEDRVANAADGVEKITGNRPNTYSDYKKLLKSEELDGVIIATWWQTHIPIAIAAMKSGIPAGIEVGGASSLEDCVSLARTYEETGKFCMILQNCNYGREEMALLNMAKKGVFGEIVHVQCGYEHDLRASVARSEETRYHRLPHYIYRNGELYPNHGLGPMMKLLNINRGNRMVSLVSVSSKAVGLKEWAKNNLPPEHYLHNTPVNQGDIVNTIIKCAGGETILLTHDTTLPRPYSRGGRVQGTKGLWYEDNKSIYIEGESPEHTWEDFYEYIKKNGYEHPLWKEYFELDIKEQGHGGMDYLVLRAFIEDGILKSIPPIDTYESALLSAITPLSEKSVALGSQPMDIPDFAHGKWLIPEPAVNTKYGLN
ncbi:MAG: Gfo/Idh/MocA family oxidoreductase [Oscillospiraceae bacterium]|nr:Gfo/Idh/MocA family oxidoreductase [Oscillospiraceae bacterium]